jgi:hypothetical protein
VLSDDVAAGVHRLVRSRAQVGIVRDPPVLHLNSARGQVEPGDIGDAPGAVDHPLGLNGPLRTALFIDHAKPDS